MFRRERITRIVSVKSFYSEEYQKEGDAPKDTILEEELAKWIMENMPGIQAMAGFTAAEKVEKYLHDFPEDFKLAVDAVYLFVMTEKVTHYIQAVDLGASKYSLSVSKKSQYSEEVGLEATVEKVCSGKAKAERVEENLSKTKEDRVIGDIENVSRNNGEEVVGVKIMPIFTLLTKGVIKQVLQKAIILYLNRAS